MGVAPLAGAWIETELIKRDFQTSNVAPLAGAWIETLAMSIKPDAMVVAPLAGAWIETCNSKQFHETSSCRTPRGCVD